MELKLLDFQSVSLSELAIFGRTYWSPFSTLRHTAGVRFSTGSCRGISVKVSSSSTSNGTYLSKKPVSSDDQEKTAPEKYLYRINGANGSNSSLFSGRMKVLDAFDDEYGGVVVDSKNLPKNSDDFASALHFSLSHWKITEGFQYHHAEPAYVMLTYWLPEEPCMLPANATHQVGVGGFVINDKNEILVVQEKFCAPSFFGLWKIPTGFIHESEEIYTGAVREVKEETGIDTEFIEVVAFRHAHNLAFDKSDLFFVCMLKPLSTQIIVDDLEIQAAKWMPLLEFVKQPLIEGDSMFKKIIDICIARLGKRYCGLSKHQLVSKFDGRLSCLYYNVIDAADVNCRGN
ncbi:nudix hydrolase 8 isoform X2 [Manihot esculenta]|uniref:Nudix hydrolase domain-containing protein n=1 Tax=Manihot esculenta TaxID=3983 RepID=A0A2C9WD35_MANES|nr:nudix hydrolase 8 isoform X2 [Manihot esculenta]OAY56759.1 hypothetical protein MANES_02G042300v8 [Manihot esculenta]